MGGNDGALKLDPRDKLYIVHVGDKAERRRTSGTGRGALSWDAGGPLIQPLQVGRHPSDPTPPHPTRPKPTPPRARIDAYVQEAMAAYEHTTVELHGGHVPSVILEWATENDMTLVVAGAPLSHSQPMTCDQSFAEVQILRLQSLQCRLPEGEGREDDREESCTWRMGHRIDCRCDVADNKAAAVGGAAGAQAGSWTIVCSRATWSMPKPEFVSAVGFASGGPREPAWHVAGTHLHSHCPVLAFGQR